MSDIKQPKECHCPQPVEITKKYSWTLKAYNDNNNLALNWHTDCPGGTRWSQIKIYDGEFQVDPGAQAHGFVDSNYNQPWKTDKNWGKHWNIGWIGRSTSAWHYIVKTTTDHSKEVVKTVTFEYTLKAYEKEGYLTIDFSKSGNAEFDLGSHDHPSLIRVYKRGEGFPVDPGQGDNAYSALEPIKTYNTNRNWGTGIKIAWIVMGVDGKWHYLVQLTT